MRHQERILLVDDETRVLDAVQRGLHNQFDIETAGSPSMGLEALQSRGPFAVVVSDLRMPGMDGVEFLTRVKAASPDSIRVMLTGQADLDAAIAVVNEGSIFRFLTKPCPVTVLQKTLEAALDQHRLVRAERELLERTLMGSVTVLTEILSVVYPAAFSRSLRIKRYVKLLAEAAGLHGAWQVEVAAVLCQIGCITLPMGTADKVYAGAELAPEERRMFARHPGAAATFLRSIPRLESTAQIIAMQQKPYREYEAAPAGVNGHIVTIGGQMLHIAVDLEKAIGRGLSFEAALSELRGQEGEYNPDLLQALEERGEPVISWSRNRVGVNHLDTSMVADEDVRARNGLLLVSSGEPFTYPAIERLRTFALEIGIVEPIRVLVPQDLCVPVPAQA